MEVMEAAMEEVMEAAMEEVMEAAMEAATIDMVLRIPPCRIIPCTSKSY